MPFRDPNNPLPLNLSDGVLYAVGNSVTGDRTYHQIGGVTEMTFTATSDTDVQLASDINGVSAVIDIGHPRSNYWNNLRFDHWEDNMEYAPRRIFRTAELSFEWPPKGFNDNQSPENDGEIDMGALDEYFDSLQIGRSEE